MARRHFENIAVLIVASSVACAAACSSSTEPKGASSASETSDGGSSGSTGPSESSGSNDAGSSGSSGEMPKLTCAAFGWCTTWSNNAAASKPVENPPALDGGTIADGMYRLSRGDSSPLVMYFQGGAVLKVGDNASNDLGRYTIDGSRITLTYETSCNVDGDQPYPGTPEKYAFKATPAGLYTAWIESSGLQQKEIDLWEKIDDADLCTETTSFSCHVANCGCAATKGGPLKACSK